MIDWKPNYVDEVNRRRRLFQRAREDHNFRHALWTIWKRDPVRFIEDTAITYDPRRKGMKILPFMLFPRQKEFVQFLVECLRDGENALVEKCRDMGLTWLCVSIATWMWLFEDGTAIGFGSRKQELVDRPGDPDSIFQKLRMQINYLPNFIMPYGFTPRLHSTFMKVMNPETKATITGEIGDNIGRGGRKQIYFKDESAHYERPELIEAALGDNTNVQVDISSVNGAGNVFYRRRMAGEVWEPGKKIAKGITRVFIFDWRQNPLKSQEWYDLRHDRAEREGLLHIFAQEVDRDYLSAIDNVIIPQAWVISAIDAHIKLKLPISTERLAGQDVADKGGDKNALAIREGIILRVTEAWSGEADVAPTVGMPQLIERLVTDLYYDSIGVGTGFKGGVNALIRTETWPKRVKVHPWAGSDAVLNPLGHVIPGDRESPKNEDHYQNLKAQAWFLLRARFNKTFRAVTKGEQYDVNELISLDSTMPGLHELTMELSQAVHKPSATGKTMVDKTPEGTKSPNRADSVVIVYCPTPVRNTLFTY